MRVLLSRKGNAKIAFGFVILIPIVMVIGVLIYAINNPAPPEEPTEETMEQE